MNQLLVGELQSVATTTTTTTTTMMLMLKRTHAQTGNHTTCTLLYSPIPLELEAPPSPPLRSWFCSALQQHQHKYTPTGYAHTNTHTHTQTLGRVINSL